MSAKFVKFFGLIGLVVAVILAVAFKEKILLIAGVYWVSLILLTIILRIVKPEEFKTLKDESYKEEKESEIENNDFESKDDTGFLEVLSLTENIVAQFSSHVLLPSSLEVLFSSFSLVSSTTEIRLILPMKVFSTDPSETLYSFSLYR